MTAHGSPAVGSWALGSAGDHVFVPAAALAQETIAEIRVHGNHTTPDADVIGLSGLKPGDPATDARLAEAEQALRKSNRFDDVELRKRFRSIDNPADILIMIVIDERAGVSADDLTPGFGARVRSSMVWWPILNYADGYGLTYGIRPAFTDPIGQDSRLSFPFSWGGERRAGVELERSFNDQRTRAGVAFWVNRRVNPFFDVPDVRQQVRFEADHAIVPWMRVGGSARIAQVEFGDSGAPTRYDARHVAGGPHVTFDTRIDPLFPRNAIHTRIGWEAVSFETGSAGRWTTDARGYVGIGPPDRRRAARTTRSDRTGRCLRPSSRCSAAGTRCAATGPDIAPATAWRRSRQKCASRSPRRCAFEAWA